MGKEKRGNVFGVSRGCRLFAKVGPGESPGNLSSEEDLVTSFGPLNRAGPSTNVIRVAETFLVRGDTGRAPRVMRKVKPHH